MPVLTTIGNQCHVVPGRQSSYALRRRSIHARENGSSTNRTFLSRFHWQPQILLPWLIPRAVQITGVNALSREKMPPRLAAPARLDRVGTTHLNNFTCSAPALFVAVLQSY